MINAIGAVPFFVALLWLHRNNCITKIALQKSYYNNCTGKMVLQQLYTKHFTNCIAKIGKFTYLNKNLIVTLISIKGCPHWNEKGLTGPDERSLLHWKHSIPSKPGKLNQFLTFATLQKPRFKKHWKQILVGMRNS